jgi:hypothetical protein
MKESYNKGIASHVGPESCLDDPRGRREALTGESAGGLLSSEITLIRWPRQWSVSEGNRCGRVKNASVHTPGGVKEPGMRGHFPHENRETSERRLRDSGER